jgi:hypothetical protein
MMTPPLVAGFNHGVVKRHTTRVCWVPPSGSSLVIVLLGSVVPALKRISKVAGERQVS